MARTLLLVGTRKGCFVLESDESRRDWNVRGPFCESWPVYHAIYEPSSGAIFAAAASEWHGSAIWRSSDLGETWTHSSEGLAYDDGRRLSKVSTLAVDDGRVLVGVESPGIFESRDDGATWSLLSTLEGEPGSESWSDPEQQPPGHLGISALMFDRESPSRFWAIVQGYGLFETTDDGKTWTEITDGLPTEFGFAAATHPHDKDTFYVVPLDPGHARCMPDGKAAVWRTRDAGESWQRLDRGLPQQDAHVGVLREAMAIDDHDAPGLYFGTSTGQLFASADEGESWSAIGALFPGITSVSV